VAAKASVLEGAQLPLPSDQRNLPGTPSQVCKKTSMAVYELKINYKKVCTSFQLNLNFPLFCLGFQGNTHLVRKILATLHDLVQVYPD
jgi:hypothetical protein